MTLSFPSRIGLIGLLLLFSIPFINLMENQGALAQGNRQNEEERRGAGQDDAEKKKREGEKKKRDQDRNEQRPQRDQQRSQDQDRDGDRRRRAQDEGRDRRGRPEEDGSRDQRREEREKRRAQEQEFREKQPSDNRNGGQGRERERKRDQANPQDQRFQDQQPRKAETERQDQRKREGNPQPQNERNNSRIEDERRGAEDNRNRRAKELADIKAREAAEAKLRKDQAQARVEERKKAEQQRIIAQQQLILQQQAKKRQADEAYRRAKQEREDRLKAIKEKTDRVRVQESADEKRQDLIQERLKLREERLRNLREQRRETVDGRGQIVINEPGNKSIYKANNQIFIQTNEAERWRSFGSGFKETRRGDKIIATYSKQGRGRVEIEVDSYGRPIRRVRILPNGRRYTLFRNNYIAPGAGFALGAFLVDLPPPNVRIPPEEYIVDTDRASEDDLYAALEAPPIEPLDRGYTLDEVRASVRLRERMRSVNIDTITFDFGSWEVTPDQAALLETIASVMKDIINRNPGEVFLIEGHTDAVGADIDNLSLSDRRAEAVSDVLTKQFDVPPENLVTQGYGEQHLLVQTEEPERRNRRVMVRRVTPLLSNDGPARTSEAPRLQERYQQGDDLGEESGSRGASRSRDDYDRRRY